MSLVIQVISTDLEKEERWMGALQPVTNGKIDVRFQPSSNEGLSHVLFVDGTVPEFEQILSNLDRRGKAVFLLVHEDQLPPQVFLDGKVDDVLVHPFRSLEVMSKLRHYEQIMLWDELQKANESFAHLLERLKEDFVVAERLQKMRLPHRFPDLRGFRVRCRYFAGIRSGGDYFDIADSRHGNSYSIVLSDSSSYGLANTILSALMRIAVKISADEASSADRIVRRIQEEVSGLLGQKDHLSLFYGILARDPGELRRKILKYVNLGNSCIFYSDSIEEQFIELNRQGGPIQNPGADMAWTETTLKLSPGSRLILASDGFVELSGSSFALKSLLDQFRSQDPNDTLNELSFLLKKGLNEESLPAQDCTAIIVDVDSTVVSMKPKTQE